jgi:DNA-binding transcriptional LysR family regulator
MSYGAWDPRTLRQLRTFLAVADHRSFSVAADRLLVTQPAVSKHIKDLEERLGASLFDRGGRLGLTAAGYVLWERAQQVQGLMDALESVLEEAGDGRVGHLELGASNVWEYVLPPLMGEFQSHHPHVTMGLKVSNSEQITGLVAEREVHLGFVGARADDKTFEAMAVAEDELVVIAPPGHPLAATGPVSPDRLHRQVFIQRDRDSATAQLSKQYLQDLNVEPNVVMELGSDEAVKAVVQRGYGFALISAFSVRQEVLSGTLAVVALDAPPCRRQLYIIRDAKRKLSKLEESFCKFVSDSCSGSVSNALEPVSSNGHSG